MSIQLIAAEEAFMFPTHFAGDISAVDGLRFHAFRGAELVQASEGRVSIDGVITVHVDGWAPVQFALRDALSDKLTDDVAARICPGFQRMRSVVMPCPLTHYLAIISDLGVLSAFCRNTAGTAAVYSARFYITCAHASLTLYRDDSPAGVARWDFVRGDSYSFSVVMSSDTHDPHSEEEIVTLLSLLGNGFTTACVLLSRMNQAVVSPYDSSLGQLPLDDTRELN